MEDLRIKNFLKKSMYHERMIPYYMEVCDNDMFIAQYVDSFNRKKISISGVPTKTDVDIIKRFAYKEIKTDFISQDHKRFDEYIDSLTKNWKSKFWLTYIIYSILRLTPFNNLRDIINDINFYHVDNVNFHDLYHKLYYLSISHPTIFNFVLKLI
jgi:hypothetical protein